LEKDGMEARRIERAPFFVLAKSHMPSILVETAFISNRDEENKLRRRDFCRQIAQAIYRGIRQFAQEKQAKL
jgi:N-acetylmuramoyl-L-alanine amidase